MNKTAAGAAAIASSPASADLRALRDALGRVRAAPLMLKPQEAEAALEVLVRWCARTERELELHRQLLEVLGGTIPRRE